MKIESHRTFIFNDGFGKGQTIRNDSLFFVLTGPSSGDSLTFSYRVNFDHHSGIIFETIPIAPSKSNKAWRDTIEVVSIRGRTDHVVLLAADPPQFTGHNYLITFNEDPKTNKLLWSLKDDLTGELKIDKSELSNDPYFAYPVVDGILYKMTDIKEEFKNFQVISNANGLVVPPEGEQQIFKVFLQRAPQIINKLARDVGCSTPVKPMVHMNHFSQALCGAATLAGQSLMIGKCVLPPVAAGP